MRHLRNIKQAHHTVVASKFAAMANGTLQPISGKPALIAAAYTRITLHALPRLTAAQVKRIKDAYASFATTIVDSNGEAAIFRPDFEDWVEFAIE